MDPTAVPPAHHTQAHHTQAHYAEADCRIADFAVLVDRRTELGAYPHADRVPDLPDGHLLPR